MSEELEVRREADDRLFVCCCVVGRNPCAAFTSGSDEPICADCVANGHPEHEEFRPVIKPTVRRSDVLQVSRGSVTFGEICVGEVTISGESFRMEWRPE